MAAARCGEGQCIGIGVGNRRGCGSSRYACCNAKAAGDILYLPIGVFHRAWPHKGHNSVHITVAFDHKRQNWRGLASLALQKVRVRVRAAAQQEKSHGTVERGRGRGRGLGPRRLLRAGLSHSRKVCWRGGRSSIGIGMA